MDGRTILVAHADPAFLTDVVPKLSERGFHVIGPATTAKMALALAAASPASLALVGTRLAGVRSGQTLAQELLAKWGVPSLIVDDGATVEEALP
jgi:hypothetical protein